MDTKQLQAIKATAEKATPGYWSELTDDNGDCWIVMDEGHKLYIGNLEDTCEICHANAEFIIAARQDVPALIAEIERLQGWLKQAKKERDALVGAVIYAIEAGVIEDTSNVAKIASNILAGL